MNFLRICLLWVFFAPFISISSSHAYKIVASIPPVASLVQAVAGDKASIDVLIDGSQSAHTYALKPSDLNKLKNAEMIFWIGPTYETFLQKAIQAYPSKNFALIEMKGLTLHPICPSLESKSDAGCPYCDEGNPLKVDSHIWLDPNNGLAIAYEIAKLLSTHDPDNKEFYQARLQDFKTHLLSLKEEWYEQLGPVRNKVFFVFHNGYQYFEKAFDLQGGKAIMEMPDENLSIRKLTSLKRSLQEQKAQCLFAETQFSSRLIDKLAQETSIQVAVLDPLGTKETSYIELLQNLTQNFVNCFTKSSVKN